MDKDKLIKIIQLVVEKEVKKQLSQISVSATAPKKSISERKVTQRVKSPILESDNELITDMSYDERPITKSVTYTKNKAINDILNETRIAMKTGQIAPIEGDSEYRTVSFDTSNTTPESFRQSMAEKLGYGSMVNVVTTTPDNRRIDISSEAAKPVVDAMNRDYTELVKRFKK